MKTIPWSSNISVFSRQGMSQGEKRHAGTENMSLRECMCTARVEKASIRRIKFCFRCGKKKVLEIKGRVFVFPILQRWRCPLFTIICCVVCVLCVCLLYSKNETNRWVTTNTQRVEIWKNIFQFLKLRYASETVPHTNVDNKHKYYPPRRMARAKRIERNMLTPPFTRLIHKLRLNKHWCTN